MATDSRLYLKPTEIDYLIALLGNSATDFSAERYSILLKCNKLRINAVVRGHAIGATNASAMQELMQHSAGTFQPSDMPAISEQLPPGARAYNKSETDRMNDILIRACNDGVDSISMEDKEWYQEAAGFPLT